MKDGAVFTVQVHKTTFNKDGGGRIELNFQADGFEEVQAVQKATAYVPINFECALVPIAKIEFKPDE